MKHTCRDCGRETDNEKVIKSIVDGKPLFTVHRCDECQAKWDAELEFQSEGEKFREDNLICPWCDFAFEDYDACRYEEGEETEIECPECGRKFDLEVEIQRVYSTKRSLCEMDKEPAYV